MMANANEESSRARNPNDNSTCIYKCISDPGNRLLNKSKTILI